MTTEESILLSEFKTYTGNRFFFDKKTLNDLPQIIKSSRQKALEDAKINFFERLITKIQDKILLKAAKNDKEFEWSVFPPDSHMPDDFNVFDTFHYAPSHLHALYDDVSKTPKMIEDLLKSRFIGCKITTFQSKEIPRGVGGLEFPSPERVLRYTISWK